MMNFGKLINNIPCATDQLLDGKVSKYIPDASNVQSSEVCKLLTGLERILHAFFSNGCGQFIDPQLTKELEKVFMADGDVAHKQEEAGSLVSKYCRHLSMHAWLDDQIFHLLSEGDWHSD